LGAYSEAVQYALLSQEKFPLFSKTEYAETIACICLLIIAKCIDTFISGQIVDPKLEDIVKRMFDRALELQEWRQAMGLALEARKLGWLETALVKSNDPSLLKYAIDQVLLVSSHGFRHLVRSA
jgi:26S proteasome regulatory subunit N2